MKERIVELDFLKGVMIVLMVLFHLSYLKTEWAYLNDVVYTFHMSTFLIISGYLAIGGGKSLPKIIVPYVLFDIIYVLMVFWFGKALHAVNAVDHITIESIFKGVLFSPSGPYWYFHTLIICMVSHFVCKKWLKLDGIVEVIVFGVVLYALSAHVFIQMKFSNAMYFLIGVLLQMYDRRFTELIPGTLLAIVPFLLFAIIDEDLERGTLAGLTMTLLMISFLTALYSKLNEKAQKVVSALGRNSIVIFVFSPIFTVMTKPLVNILSFDSTHVIFALLGTSFVIICCFLCGKACDKLKLSRYIFFKEKVIV